MQRIACILMLLILSGCYTIRAQKPPLLEEEDVAALARELSGETAKQNLEAIVRFHRQRGSKGFHQAAELVAERLRAYGLSEVAIVKFPADGKIFYGTQRSRPAWDADFAELWDVSNDKRQVRIASFEAEPVTLAEDSEHANVTAELIDVGSGTKDSDYAGKNVKGSLVLVSAQPAAVQDLAVGKFSAAGIISYAQNQRTAWWGENQDAIRWGHLDTFSRNKTFAFMVSLKSARQFQSRLAGGEKITLRAVVKAGQRPGNYEVVTATIPGSDPKLKNEEIVFSCHLDHQRPGANDNASGCATILEVARALEKLTTKQMSGECAESKSRGVAKNGEADKFAGWRKQDCGFLIGAGQIEPAARTIRFFFPPEIEGTLAVLNDKPELAKRIKAAIHMDMVGGGPETKSVFHVTRGPLSLPSFVHDIAWAFADWLNGQSYQFAATGNAAYPMVAAEGGREPLRAEYAAYTMGSDHDVYQDSSFAIPAIYLNDWPDRFIHTNFDAAANIDPTKLKRAAFIGAASGYFLARVNDHDLPAIFRLLQMRTLRTAQEINRKGQQISEACEGGELQRFEEQNVLSLFESVKRFGLDATKTLLQATARAGSNVSNNTEGICGGMTLLLGGNLVFRRKPAPKGPLTVFGYDYFSDHAKSAGISTTKLFDYEGLWGEGQEYAYEVLNFADGKRNAQEIRDAASAEYGPIPLELVVQYLEALEKIDLIEHVK